MSALVSHEILWVFVYILACDGKYPVEGFENIQLPNEMQLSEKGKTFSRFFVAFI